MVRRILYNISEVEYASLKNHPKNGPTIGNYLRTKGYSKHILAELKQIPGRIKLNGRNCHVYEKLQPGDRLLITMIETGPESCPTYEPAENTQPPQIVYEDEDILVINKPAFMPVHQSAGHYGDTLADFVNHYLAAMNTSITYRCINRLDRDTTGILIIAKHMLSGAILSSEMKQRHISRTYQAIVHGRVDHEGTINMPIARLKGSALRRCIDEQNGERAVTHYKPLIYSAAHNISLVEIQLETGRTHQIRVHFTAIGHPLVGDDLYTDPVQVLDIHLSDPNVLPKPEKINNTIAISRPMMNRQALHSARLQFIHPVTGCLMDLHAPMPADMRIMVSDLKPSEQI